MTVAQDYSSERGRSQRTVDGVDDSWCDQQLAVDDSWSSAAFQSLPLKTILEGRGQTAVGFSQANAVGLIRFIVSSSDGSKVRSFWMTEQDSKASGWTWPSLDKEMGLHQEAGGRAKRTVPAKKTGNGNPQGYVGWPEVLLWECRLHSVTQWGGETKGGELEISRQDLSGRWAPLDSSAATDKKSDSTGLPAQFQSCLEENRWVPRGMCVQQPWIV